MAACLFCAAASAAEDDLTSRIERRLPFLKSGVRFEESCVSRVAGGDVACIYEVVVPDGSRLSLKRPEDFKPILAPIDNRTQALQFVRFLSDPPSASGGRLLPFEGVPFYELAETIGPAGEAPLLAVPPGVLAAYWVEPPRAAMVRVKEGEWRFVVTRYVFLREEAARVEGGGAPRRIARAEETLDREGNYELKLETIPVDSDFAVKVFPRRHPPGGHPTS